MDLNSAPLDEEFGYRFLADEARDAGLVLADRTAWRICRDNGWWSVFGKKRSGTKAKIGAPAHDDLVRRDFTASAPNQLWLTDLTEHQTREGKLYLCAIKDVWSNRIVGYSMSDRMESQIAVDALVPTLVPLASLLRYAAAADPEIDWPAAEQIARPTQIRDTRIETSAGAPAPLYVAGDERCRPRSPPRDRDIPPEFVAAAAATHTQGALASRPGRRAQRHRRRHR